MSGWLEERRVAGLVLVLLGALALHEAWRLLALREEMVAGAVVGDDTLPWLIGAALLVVGLYALLVARWPPAHVRLPAGGAGRRFAGSAATLIAYYVITPYLGYTLSTLVAGAALFRVMGCYRWPVALAIAGLTAGALYAIFRIGLTQPLPTGWLGI